MNNRKWLKRKYPKTFKEVNVFLNDEKLEDFKKRKWNLGRLSKNVGKYKAGNLIMFKRSNPIKSYNYPMHQATIKCDVSYILSGYHAIGVWEEYFIEIKK